MDSARRSNGWPSIFTSHDALTSTQQIVKALARLLRFASALRVTVCCVTVGGSYAGKHSFPASPAYYDFSTRRCTMPTRQCCSSNLNSSGAELQIWGLWPRGERILRRGGNEHRLAIVLQEHC